MSSDVRKCVTHFLTSDDIILVPHSIKLKALYSFKKVIN